MINGKKNKRFFWSRGVAFLWAALFTATACANIPLWTFEPLTDTKLAVPANSTALVQYRVTNQSLSPHTLVMLPIPGVMQTYTGLGDCGTPFMLPGKGYCTLSLQIIGSQLTGPILDGPFVCQFGSLKPCYRPNPLQVLNIVQAPPISNAVITVTGSPLILTKEGPVGQLTISNISTEVAATNIMSSFTGTALAGNVTETGNTCANVPPGGSCILTYTPGNTVVAQTNFTIQGTNTNALTAAIAIQSGITLTAINPNSGPASGGTGFTLTGTGLTGATSVTFDGVAATSVNVVNSTTVTGVTPAHAPAVVDVAINTPAGGATLTNGYSYLTTAVGQSSGGGVIACLNGGLNNLIAATADNSSGIQWGGSGTLTSALSTTNGALNTAQIVSTLTALGIAPNTYAASICMNYEVDSQGNTPCQAGNACYNDWFLPAGNNLTTSGQLNCLFVNRAAIGGFDVFYWSSTDSSTTDAWFQGFLNGVQFPAAKINPLRVRCVRAFTP